MTRRTSLGLLVATAATAASGVLAATPAAAATSTWYAEPGGQLTACTSQDPCNIDAAFAKAATGDTIVLTGGTYTNAGAPFSSSIALLATGVNVVDKGATLPVVDSNAAAGIILTAQSSLKGLGLNYTGSKAGIDVPAGATAQRLLVTASTAGTGCDVGGTLLDSLCHNTAGGIAVGDSGYTSPETPVLRGVTAESPAAGGIGIDYAAGTAGSGAVTVTNTIAHGAAADVQAETGDLFATTTITLDHSDFAKAVALGHPGTATAVSGAGNISGAPKFVSASKGNYKPAAGSPTIDKGAKDPASETDAAGLSRQIGGGTDIGAFERTIAPKVSKPKVTPAKKSAKVKLTVNPEGLTGTVRFRASIVKPPKGFKGKTTLTTKAKKLSAVVKGVPVSIALSGLTASTKYSIVVIARNSAGTTSTKAIKIKTKA